MEKKKEGKSALEKGLSLEPSGIVFSVKRNTKAIVACFWVGGWVSD